VDTPLPGANAVAEPEKWGVGIRAQASTMFPGSPSVNLNPTMFELSHLTGFYL
jgi:hypothetical protein